MDKQVTINEMALCLYNHQMDVDIENPCEVAELLYNAGYRKIPEGAVVLTREECEMKNYFSYRGEELLKQERKETAEKFSKKAFEVFIPLCDEELLKRKLDEICKEIINERE